MLFLSIFGVLVGYIALKIILRRRWYYRFQREASDWREIKKGIEEARFSTVRSSSRDFHVVVEYLGEHDMGATGVVLRPSRPIGGVSEFLATNGDAFFTPDGTGLFLHDRVLLLFVNVDTGEVRHLRGVFDNLRIEGDALVSDLDQKPFSMPLRKVALFHPGLGSAQDGRFPSAFP